MGWGRFCPVDVIACPTGGLCPKKQRLAYFILFNWLIIDSYPPPPCFYRVSRYVVVARDTEVLPI